MDIIKILIQPSTVMVYYAKVEKMDRILHNGLLELRQYLRIVQKESGWKNADMIIRFH